MQSCQFVTGLGPQLFPGLEDSTGRLMPFLLPLHQPQMVPGQMLSMSTRLESPRSPEYRRHHCMRFIWPTTFTAFVTEQKAETESPF